jgi:hypothetical protein
MGAFNRISAKLVCPSCGFLVDVVVQFKYGRTWLIDYKLGDELQWGGLERGERGRRHVVVDGCVEKQCANCRYEEWDVYVHVEHDRLTYVENANGQFNFAKLGSNYIVVT